MKLMKMIGMAMMATALCMPFTSCGGSDDDDNDGGSSIVNSGKKLKSITCSDGSSSSTKYVYGAEGYLANATTSYGDKLGCTWGESQVTFKDNYSTTVCTLTNGKITKAKDSDNGTCTLSYDGNYLIYVQEGDGDIRKWVWKNGNIVEYYKNDELRKSFEYYTDKPNKHYTDVDVERLRLYDALPLEYGSQAIAAHPGLIGASNKNLLKKVTDDDGDVYEYTYTLDSEGYPTTIVETESYKGSSSSSTTYTLTWE